MRKTFKVVGLTFRDDYPNNLYRLRDVEESFKREYVNGSRDSETVELVLVRDAENPYDENAVEVHAPLLGRGGSMVGFVPKILAKKLAEKMDAGASVDAELSAVLVSPENPDNPGIEICVNIHEQ